MTYNVAHEFGILFVEVSKEDVKDDTCYLFYNDTYYRPATEFFKEQGIPCSDAYVTEGDITLVHLSINGDVDVRALGAISISAKICLKKSAFDDNYIEVEFPI
jgi:hypothetical protein